jgi:SAM-dependent methyltransferase
VGAFGRYALLYDRFYEDRDYAGEIAFVRSVIERHAPDARSLLDAGCGTGVHAAALSDAGFDVTGVDASATMIDEARKRAPAARLEIADIRELYLGRSFDAASSLFHVMSYQATAADLRAALGSIRRHLETGGTFLFDFWYGPRVLASEPAAREKTVEHEGRRWTRRAEPRHVPEHQSVDVVYRLRAEPDVPGTSDEFSEVHRLRYFFRPELDAALREARFASEEFGPWPGTGPDGYWHYIVARAV